MPEAGTTLAVKTLAGQSIIAGLLSRLLYESPEAFVVAEVVASKENGVIDRNGPAGGIDATEIGLVIESNLRKICTLDKMSIGESGRGAENGTSAKKVAVEDCGSKLCVPVEDSVFECNDTAEGAAVEAGSAVEYGVSKPGLGLERRAVENHIGFELHYETVRLGPGACKDGIFLKNTFIKDYRLRQCQSPAVVILL